MSASSARRVLIVEDEYLLADDLKKALAEDGAAVVGPVPTATHALALLNEESVDCAILDINLRGQMVYPLANRLREMQVPFLFVSGYDAAAPGAGFDDVVLIQKPFTSEAVVAAIERLMQQEAGSAANLG